MNSKAKAAVLCGYGINCEYETEHALRASGAEAARVHVHDLVENPKMLENFNLLAFPGGFSYGDDLGSGKVLANKMRFRMKEQMQEFVKQGKLVIGICNGFQMIAKMGLLPYNDFEQKVTLTFNDSGKFEDRWVYLKMNPKSPCVFTQGIGGLMLPVRHGEGKFMADPATLKDLGAKNMVAMQYVNEKDELAGYPYNPNGSLQSIAGICNEQGNVFGLMPHPEAYNIMANNPFWPSVKDRITDWKGSGMKVFENAVSYLNAKF
ncbi:Phosphoribosylformylglycinamidine synthase subunit PurQ [Candidatus Burarchaeum australiense]|nr:Phosphoribosylformylglycinamidine synthase subunit PurQ [Candidatus Burarchaeum australiense]